MLWSASMPEQACCYGTPTDRGNPHLPKIFVCICFFLSIFLLLSPNSLYDPSENSNARQIGAHTQELKPNMKRTKRVRVGSGWSSLLLTLTRPMLSLTALLSKSTADVAQVWNILSAAYPRWFINFFGSIQRVNILSHATWRCPIAQSQGPHFSDSELI